MLGGLGNLGALFKQARSFQENMQKMQETLAQQRYEADAGAGMVTATVDGKGELIRIKIDPKAVSDVELLEDMVTAAVTSATRKAQEGMKAEMARLTGGLDLGSLGGLLGQGT
ncbi:MAG TPA: YbaB/EbfC family nucleoid-associated protein [Phycisphaerae bacterium]|jgi:DNA-binding YbaB/EbfC family protein|nr:YbaB/EbfC family nucleoid-associated protein [Phycisphaerae bacterium]HOB73019.1 YbaB/EbfC family nucleoid-associated protein [Phycisphaerae bacterium]HOJ52932.1 YbaB/EbfC family nucleoid-associated protein [Phycisphaerae bacterium]HOL24669.1 YbaB/EbfC family nucleoid-associated protein [Phycisphaerae bacterium]HPP19205.1 YbaB/EbfC family nucleoid-associated protein [Phycisphaerae bacterium]